MEFILQQSFPPVKYIKASTRLSFLPEYDDAKSRVTKYELVF